MWVNPQNAECLSAKLAYVIFLPSSLVVKVFSEDAEINESDNLKGVKSVAYTGEYKKINGYFGVEYNNFLLPAWTFRPKNCRTC